MLFGVFYLVLILTSEDKTIKIGRGTTPSGQLALTPSGKVRVYPGKKVIWSINNSSNVKSIEIKPKNPDSENVFEGNPPRGDRESDAVGKLKDRDTEIEYDYSIIWFDTSNGGPYTHDPKIAIKPGTLAPIEVLIYIAYAFFAGLISYLTFRKR
jgi:hypothetical protein